MNRIAKAVGLLVIAGLVKIPLEQRLTDELRKEEVLETPVGIDLRENLGQAGFAASLGGLRSLVASVTYLQAYGAFEDLEWGKVDSLMTLTTRLEPRNASYWDEASWHMAYNAASYYQRTEKRAALRDRLFRDYVQRGIDILHEGLRYLPNNRRLLAKLAMTYSDRTSDHAKAAEAYLQAYKFGPHTYQDPAERFAAYELVKVGTHEADLQAYEIMKRYYDMGLRKRGTTIMIDLAVLENRLHIPPDQRCKPMADDALPQAGRYSGLPGSRLKTPGAKGK